MLSSMLRKLGALSRTSCTWRASLEPYLQLDQNPIPVPHPAPGDNGRDADTPPREGCGSLAAWLRRRHFARISCHPDMPVLYYLALARNPLADACSRDRRGLDSGSDTSAGKLKR